MCKYVACQCVHLLLGIYLCNCTSQSFYVIFLDTFNWPRSIFRVAFSRVYGCRYFYVHFETGAVHILQVEWIHLCVSTREPDPDFETLYKGWWTQWGRRLEGWPNTTVRLSGWRRAIRQVWICTWWTGRTVCFFHTVPISLIGDAQLRVDGISSCCYIVL